MGILRAEPAVYPENLFADVRFRRTPSERSWWVFHTKPRQEKAFGRDLLAQSIPYFLPTTKRSFDREKKGPKHSFLPLFASYAFGFLSEEERLAALRTKRIVHALRVDDQPRLWSQLAQLEQLLRLGYHVHPVLRIEPGSQVVVRRGKLRGMTGTVERANGRHRFIVRIDFIQRGAAVEINEGDLNLAGVDSQTD